MPPKIALERMPLPDARGRGVSFWRMGLGELAREEGPVLVLVEDFLAIVEGLLRGPQLWSTSMSIVVVAWLVAPASSFGGRRSDDSGLGDCWTCLFAGGERRALMGEAKG